MQKSDNLIFDAEHIWHPYSSVTMPSPTHEVSSAQGVRLTLADGREIIDGMSSWWSAIHGYNHPRLNQAAKQQIDNMSHVMFGGLTHSPAIELARKLISITAEPLQKVFFADSGSVSVEVAIKMAIQYWFAQGKTDKRQLLTIRNGYHGDTFGAMSVSDPDNGMHYLFENVLAKHIFAPAPDCQHDEDWQPEDIAVFKQLIIANHQELAAVILEPLVQGAGGMRFYCPEYLRNVRTLCDEYDVLLILDEIATGFGRTGSDFGCNTMGIKSPDMMTFAKQLSSAYMPISASAIKRDMYTAMIDQTANAGAFGHGYTYSGHPVACAVALKVLEIYQRDEIFEKAAITGKYLQKRLAEFSDHPLVGEVRGSGLLGAIELVADKKTGQPFVGGAVGGYAQKMAQDSGLLIRAVAGSSLGFCPPLIITEPQIDELIGKVSIALDKTLEHCHQHSLIV